MTSHDEIPGFLLLEDGTLFRGRHAGHAPMTVAEVVFTTNMTGYQETFSDPSYRGQIVVMTAPMIGNYGVNAEDPESDRPQVAGVVVRELSRTYSNWRASGDLLSWLSAANVPILEGVDTRQLTKHLRSAGVMRGVIAAGTEVTKEVLAALDACPSMEGLDLASVVTTDRTFTWGSESAPYRIVAYDYGIKQNILRLFEANDCHVTVVPSTTPPEEVLALKPSGVFFSNGPGDPAAVSYAPHAIRTIGDAGVPVFGICLGHQMIGLSYGASTVKMPFGHHGGNHPVKELETGRVLITSQNHGFAVQGDEHEIPGAPSLQVTHVNLNDGTVEGLRHRDLPIFSVQYHPEAAPGPHDARPLFKQFIKAVRDGAGRSGPNA
ncbi:MAG TPA: glutamine-hydrolyzing carbamoyl-phosphate synthase small subunit [Gemmatimonadaceae bacterium]|mgnify:CR=1 FL=1|nr:glutamine-hydrolyzing carbamoyl-phosphate synthase small subunit [Gemmatimonadaceae bacterium]